MEIVIHGLLLFAKVVNGQLRARKRLARSVYDIDCRCFGTAEDVRRWQIKGNYLLRVPAWFQAVYEGGRFAPLREGTGILRLALLAAPARSTPSQRFSLFGKPTRTKPLAGGRFASAKVRAAIGPRGVRGHREGCADNRPR